MLEYDSDKVFALKTARRGFRTWSGIGLQNQADYALVQPLRGRSVPVEHRHPKIYRVFLQDFIQLTLLDLDMPQKVRYPGHLHQLYTPNMMTDQAALVARHNLSTHPVCK